MHSNLRRIETVYKMAEEHFTNGVMIYEMVLSKIKHNFSKNIFQ